MWSLPDINRMNKDAEAAAKKRKRAKPKDLLDGHTCDQCGAPATDSVPWYDLFSDDPKGYHYMCSAHEMEDSDLFFCDECGRYVVKNYTWELYYVIENGGMTCLRCKFHQYVADESHWITDIPEKVDLEFIRKHARHLIAVKSTYWQESLQFVDNAEFDNMSGSQISGEDLGELLAKAIKKHGKCLLILDAAYQFAVSVGVYAPRKRRKAHG